jgi:glycerophosphoryl diester phosphodiesterase
MSYKPEIVSPYFQLLDKKVVKRLNAEHFKIIPWTVNEVDDIKTMIALKVDGIITDYPDRLIKILNINQ